MFKGHHSTFDSIKYTFKSGLHSVSYELISSEIGMTEVVNKSCSMIPVQFLHLWSVISDIYMGTVTARVRCKGEIDSNKEFQGKQIQHAI